MADSVISSTSVSSAMGKTGRSRTSGISRWIADIIKYLLLIVLAASFVLPFYWMATSALKNDSQVYTVPPVLIPNPAFWENFEIAWTMLPFTQYTLNTVFKYAIPATVGVVLSSAVVAYGFARLRWPGRDKLFFLCLATMMVPFQVTMVPLFMVFKELGWINSFRPLVIPAFFGSPYYIFLLRQFFLTIPSELSDAARIDGANELGILFRIILPLSKPALTVVALFSFVDAWNDYLGPVVYLNDQAQFVLALGVQALRRRLMYTSLAVNSYPYLMAVSTIVTVPILIAFFFGQRSFIEGISLTGMKG